MTSGSRSPRTQATDPPAQDLVQPLPLPVEEPAQSAPLSPAPAARPTPKELALSHLASPSQRQLVEALADQQSLPDDYPIWAIVAMLGTVVSAAPPRRDQSGFESTLAQKSDTDAAISRRAERGAAPRDHEAEAVARLFQEDAFSAFKEHLRGHSHSAGISIR